MSDKTVGYIIVSLLFTFASAVTISKVDHSAASLLAIVMLAYAGFALYQASKN